MIRAAVLCLVFLPAALHAEPNQAKKPKPTPKPPKAQPAPPQAFTCSGKHLCKQMDSCAEAVFYLTQCGVDTLDRDHDTIPCEAICNPK